MRTLLCAAVSAIAVTAAPAAQKPEDQRFEVVGIGVTLHRLIALAYLPLPSNLIDGGPPCG